MVKFLAGTVSTQINQNFHAWSPDVREFNSMEEAMQYAELLHEKIMRKYSGITVLETAFCYPVIAEMDGTIITGSCVGK